jgi:hypothetical protein
MRAHRLYSGSCPETQKSEVQGQQIFYILEHANDDRPIDSRSNHQGSHDRTSHTGSRYAPTRGFTTNYMG